jgi:hypothetical protein
MTSHVWLLTWLHALAPDGHAREHAARVNTSQSRIKPHVNLTAAAHTALINPSKCEDVAQPQLLALLTVAAASAQPRTDAWRLGTAT